MGTSLRQSHHAEIHFSLIAPWMLPEYLYFVLHCPIMPVRLSRALSICRVTTLMPRELSQRQGVIVGIKQAKQAVGLLLDLLAYLESSA